MRYSSSVLAALAAAPLLASARPVQTRAAASANVALVFQFANVLEQLESTFYQQGLAKFQAADFQAAGFSSPMIPTQILTTIQSDEATHDTFIQQALTANGVTPLTCNFDFGNALSDVATMAATARVVEYVGVAAYSGAANLLDVPNFLDAAASILTVEARHQSLLNILSGTGSAIPSAFDVGFTPQEVLSIAGGFIKGPCDLGLNATNSLAVTNEGTISPGDLLTVSATGVTGTDNLFCNMIVGGAAASLNLPLAQCIVPPGTNGPVALWITSDATPIPNDVVARATVPTLAGPALFFVDSQTDMLSQLVRSTGASASNGTSTATGTDTSAPPTGTGIDNDNATTPPAAPQSIAELAALQTSKKTVFETCAADSECQQGCCGFSSGKCAGPDVAQSNGSGGCGFGNTSPNCDVATLLGFSNCIAGVVPGNLQAADVQQAAAFAAQLDNLPFTPSASASGATTGTSATPTGIDNDNATTPPSGAASPSPPQSIAQLAALQTPKKTVFETCAADSECQQGCCGFSSGKCAGPDVAQSNGSGGCGFGNTSPNCDVATLLGFSNCVAGVVQGNLKDADVQQAAAFAAQLDNLPFTPSK